MIKPLFQNLVVMVNGTEASMRAVQYSVLMAKLYRCNVSAIYVVDTATIKQLMLSRVFIEEEGLAYEQSLEDNGRRYLSYAEDLGSQKGVSIDAVLKKGAVWSEVVSFAEEKKASAILIGACDGEGTDEKEISSSTYKSILLHARCSIITVKEPLVEQLYKLA